MSNTEARAIIDAVKKQGSHEALERVAAMVDTIPLKQGKSSWRAD